MESDNHGEKQGEKQINKNLKPYLWKKGQSGNPKGRPPGKTLKTFAREYLESLPDDEKIDYLASLPTDIVWKMAEGNPKDETKLDYEFPSTLIEAIRNATPNKGRDSTVPTEDTK